MGNFYALSGFYGEFMNVGCSRWWRIMSVSVFIVLLWPRMTGAEQDRIGRNPTQKHYTAFVNITYKDHISGKIVSEKEQMGTYGLSSRLDNESGTVVHVRTKNNHTHGCDPLINVPPKGRWVALIRRGGCKFTMKIRNAAVRSNASAVVIYNHKYEEEGNPLIAMQHAIDDVVSIFIGKDDGERIAKLVDNGTKVYMYITLGSVQDGSITSMNKTSVIFVSVSFIVLMIISLGWLVFYYIQRFRYAHAKDRLSKRLMSAAKKAITRMPVKMIKHGDRELEGDLQCAVCIEGYRAAEVARILPCKHFFHKSCVDPWLIEQRNCPMCKMDILKAYGLQVQGDSHDNVHSIDTEGASAAMLPTEATPSSSDMAGESTHIR